MWSSSLWFPFHVGHGFFYFTPCGCLYLSLPALHFIIAYLFLPAVFVTFTPHTFFSLPSQLDTIILTCLSLPALLTVHYTVAFSCVMYKYIFSSSVGSLKKNARIKLACHLEFVPSLQSFAMQMSNLT